MEGDDTNPLRKCKTLADTISRAVEIWKEERRRRSGTKNK
jgi:hypothetical protein